MPIFLIRTKLMYCIIFSKSEVARDRKNASLFYNAEKSVHVKLDSLKHTGLFKPLLEFLHEGGGSCSTINLPSLLSAELFQY